MEVLLFFLILIGLFFILFFLGFFNDIIKRHILIRKIRKKREK